MAVFNNGFPMSYQPLYYQQPAYQQNYQNQNNNGIIWVQGEAGMKAYLVAPNTTVALWDTERQTIYLKSADASGMPSVKILDYTTREQPQQTANQQNVEYATKDEVAALSSQLNKIQSRLNNFNKKEGQQ